MFEWGLIEKYDDRDFLVWSDNPLVQLANPHKKLQQFDQSLRPIDRMSCSIFSANTMLAYNTGEYITQQDVQEESSLAIEQWVVDPNEWAYFVDAMNFTRKRAKERFWLEMRQYRIKVQSREFAKALDLWRAFVVWYYSSPEMRMDSEIDGIVNGDGSEFDKGTGHAVGCIYKTDWVYFVNSYVHNRQHNTFKVDNIAGLIENGVMFTYAYTLVPTWVTENNTRHQENIADILRARQNGITDDDQVVEDIRRWNYTQKVQMILIAIRTARKMSQLKS